MNSVWQDRKIKLLEEIHNWSEVVGVNAMNSILLWIGRRWGQGDLNRYLEAWTRHGEALETQTLLTRFGFLLPDPETCPSWYDTLTPAQEGFSGPMISRILDLAWRLNHFQPKLAFDICVNQITEAVRWGTWEVLDWLGEQGLIDFPEDVKSIKWDPRHARCLLANMEARIASWEANKKLPGA